MCANPELFNLFTPSELVLLNGEKFVKKFEYNSSFSYGNRVNPEFPDKIFSDPLEKTLFSIFDPRIYLLDNRTLVDAQELAEAILLAAILANLQVGAIDIEVNNKKILHIPFTNLYALPRESSVSWHTHSLEHFVFTKSRKRGEIDWIVYCLLNEDEDLGVKSYRTIIKLVKQGMAKRDLLTVVKRKALVAFPYVDYELPETTAILATQNSVEPIQKSLKEYESNNLDTWKLLLEKIRKGVQSHSKD